MADTLHFIVGLVIANAVVYAAYALTNAITARILERRRRREIGRALWHVPPLRVRKVDQEVRRG